MRIFAKIYSMSLKEQRNHKRKLFQQLPQKQPKTQATFTIKLHFVTSNQISTYRKLNLSFTSSIYLVVLPLSRNVKKTLVFLLFLKRNKPQTSKSTSCKKPFIKSKCGKIRTRIIPNADTFHEVIQLMANPGLTGYIMEEQLSPILGKRKSKLLFELE